jgi:hypothetical protein
VIASLVALSAIASFGAVEALDVTGAPALAANFGRALPEASGGLDVLPFPGTPDAPPGTRIDFPALSPSQLVSVRVAGSRSGPHSGTLSAQPGGRGTQFAPDRPFVSGERVSVRAALRSEAAAAAAGAPGAHGLRFSFQIAAPAEVSGSAPLVCADSTACKPTPDRPIAPRPRGANRPLTHTFHSAPHLHPPVVTMVGKDTDTAAGDIFLDARGSGHNGPYILSPAGGLVWFGQFSGGKVASDVRVQRYAHHRVLTYYRGPGVGVLLNEHYQRIHTVTAGDGYRREGLTTHEYQLTPEGTALAEVHADVHANLTSVGGPPNGIVGDSIIQEIDIATNRVVWEWSALGHVPLRDSYARYQPGVPFDAFHLNSIQQLRGGNVLVSMRHMWAVISINKRSGKINWELGGKHSSFSIGPGAHFEWQHDARMPSHGLLTVFDNGAGLTKNESQSRALEIALRGRSARLVHAYEHIPPVLAWSQGSVQLLPGGNVFVGWGFAPTFSEYTPAGRQIFRGWFRAPVQSYRAYRGHWTGKPLWPPSIDVRRAGSHKLIVYASWNGATQVARWRVLAGASKKSLKRVARAPRHRFETRIPVHTKQPYVEVQALGARGRVLGTSNAVSSKGGCGGPEC